MAEQTAPEQPKPRLFVIAEDKVQMLFNEFQELPFKVASPLINFLQKNLQEVRPEQIKEAPSESTEPIKEG